METNIFERIVTALERINENLQGINDALHAADGAPITHVIDEALNRIETNESPE